MKTVKYLLYAHPYDMGGFPIRQPFPTNNIESIGPFILLHHAYVKVPTHIPPKQAGVGPHPHRGFAPVTFIFEGAVHHRDSRGNSSIVEKGGVQWMNAGMGVIHSERPPENIHEIGGIQEIIQLWVNTPAKHKMDEPVYIPLKKDEIPSFNSEDGLAVVNVVAGEVNGVKGKIEGLSPLSASTILLKNNAKISLIVADKHESLIYVLSGKIKLPGYGEIEHHHAVVFNIEENSIEIEATEDARLLFLTGENIPEKMVAQGPFVMNSESEIMIAYRDYQMGKMGVLIEE